VIAALVLSAAAALVVLHCAAVAVEEKDEDTDLRSCQPDVRKYLYEALEFGPHAAGPPGAGGLSSCACLLDAHTGFTPLHEVAYRGGARAGGLVRVLVNAYAWALETDLRGATPLHVAAARGEFIAAASLCSFAARSDYLATLLAMRQADDAVALDLAEAAGHVEMSRLLVRRGAPRGGPDPGPGECTWALVDAVLLGDAEELGARLGEAEEERGAGADCLTPPPALGRTALHVAVAATGLLNPPAGRRIVELLLERGANASRVDAAAGETPLATAARTDRADVVEVLARALTIAGGLDGRDLHGRTALHQASRVGAQDSAWMLVLSGASVEIRDDQGLTPLDYATQEGHDEVVEKIGAASKIPRGEGVTPGNSKAVPSLGAGGGDQLVQEPDGDDGDGGGSIGIVAVTIGVLLGAICGLFCALMAGKAYSARSKAAVCAMPGSEPPLPESVALAAENSGCHGGTLRRAAAEERAGGGREIDAGRAPPTASLVRPASMSPTDASPPVSPSSVSAAKRRGTQRGQKAALAGGGDAATEPPIVVVASHRRTPARGGDPLVGRGGAASASSTRSFSPPQRSPDDMEKMPAATSGRLASPPVSSIRAEGSSNSKAAATDSGRGLASSSAGGIARQKPASMDHGRTTTSLLVRNSALEKPTTTNRGCTTMSPSACSTAGAQLAAVDRGRSISSAPPSGGIQETNFLGGKPQDRSISAGAQGRTTPATDTREATVVLSDGAGGGRTGAPAPAGTATTRRRDFASRPGSVFASGRDPAVESVM